VRGGSTGKVLIRLLCLFLLSLFGIILFYSFGLAELKVGIQIKLRRG